jgi:hypothetical protein
MYLGFLARAENYDSCLSLRYDDLRKHLITRDAYKELCDYLGRENDDTVRSKWQEEAGLLSLNQADDEYFNKKNENSFDNGSVIEHVMRDFKRSATGDDLRQMFEVLYKVPMSGEEQQIADGGAR